MSYNEQSFNNETTCVVEKGQLTIMNNKKIKSKSKSKSNKTIKLVIVEENDKFVNQVYRKDILENMLLHKHLTGKELYDLIMTENHSSNTPSDSRLGDTFETLCEILTLLKCIHGLDYTKFLHGNMSCLKPLTNVKMLLSHKIHQGGNVSDISIQQEETIVGISVKYKKKVSKKGTDISDLDNTLKQNTDNYKVGLIIKSKTDIRSSKKKDIHKDIYDKIVEDNLLFDENDILIALNTFCERFKDADVNIDKFMELINTEYLLSRRQQLVKKLHQQMTENKFKHSLSITTKKHNMWCVAHKPRSGKSISLLSISRYLLDSRLGPCKILIMTSVPATIRSFIDDLEKYIDFKHITYKSQDETDKVDETFHGIVFCSVQYLKTDKKGKKRDFLKTVGFDVIIMDECHLGGSTDKTKMDILDVDDDVEDIRNGIKLNIFASGTADKTRKYYNIPYSCVYEWEIEDEAYMKELANPVLSIQDKNSIIEAMTRRHGSVFTDCLCDNTLNQDYSKHPAQVLMKYKIPIELIEEINAYNNKHGTKFGFNCSSLFALRQFINDEGVVDFAEEFDLCKDADGVDIMMSFVDCIISKNKNRENSIMKQIEHIQTSNGSRISTKENPLLFIVYLPIHTGNGTISKLQKTLIKFLETHKYWTDYNIEASNSVEDTGDVKEEYNERIKTMMCKTRAENKRGCILLLGNKGSVGITYHHCDVTISLDDGHNLDNQKQRFSRALTEAEGKTVGINVDMNVQRSYMYVMDILHKHRKMTKTTMTNAEILQYLFVHNIFLFDPQQINYGKLMSSEILRYYIDETENMMKEVDDTQLLEGLICDDDMREFIKMDFQKKEMVKKINAELEGEQQDCPKGEKTKIQVDSLKGGATVDENDEEKSSLTEEESAKLELLTNQTLEMCKSFLFPLLALISRSYKVFDFKEIFTNENTMNLIFSLLKDKKIELNDSNKSHIINIMNNIIEGNDVIVNNIRDIYSRAPAHKLRDMIEKHFVPTNDEKKKNAEVPTPVKLVDEMLDVVPLEFWMTPKKVFEPCCGKGNFVLGIFDRFYKGLVELYPDEIERCRVIMTECIYYADLTALNVFITTEIMKCHVQSYCGLDELDFEFNSYVGDTLKLDVGEKWGISLEEVSIIGNPPYSTDPSKPDTKPLYDKFIEKYISGRLLLFVVPSRWFIGGKGLDGFRDFMMKRKDIVFIQHEDDATKWFGNKVDIKGGVNYFLKYASYNGLCLFNGEPYDLSKYDCIIKPKYHKIIDIVINMESIVKNYCSSGYFKYRTNDIRLKINGKIKCYVSTLKSKDRCQYIDTYEFNEKNSFWKVITARAAFKAFSGFGEKFVGNPNEIYTDSYISFHVNNEEEAKSLLSYLDTKFANHMLSIRKISQDISENTCKWIPLVPLDRIWTDDKVCEYLKIERTMYI
jgi:site-specific DNA-methyltransferase (adenine-specific)